MRGWSRSYHAFVEAPADDDDEGGVEKGGLNGGAKDVGEGEVHLGRVSCNGNGVIDTERQYLIVPGFVNCRQMLGEFLYQRY